MCKPNIWFTYQDGNIFLVDCSFPNPIAITAPMHVRDWDTVAAEKAKQWFEHFAAVCGATVAWKE